MCPLDPARKREDTRSYAPTFRGPAMRTIGTIPITPGAVTLSQWRDIYRGVTPRLDESAYPRIEAGAEAIARIVARGEPVYGVNTGFGKLASVRIPAADLARLQRNIVLSHAAGTGEPVEKPIVRLMMALKMANLGQGVSGVRLETVRMLETMLRHDIIPVIPAQGSVGASGDLAPLAHMAAAMIGEGDVFTPTGRRHASEALFLAEHRSRWSSARRRGWRCSMARSSPPPTRWRLCSRLSGCTSARSSPARWPRKRRRDPTRRSTRASTSCAGTAARSRRPTRCGS